MSSVKALIKSFTPYQIIYLSAVVLLTFAFLVFLPEYMFEEGTSGFFLVFITIVDTLANPLCELLIAKQSKWNFVVDFFFIEIPEFLICLHFHWYAIAASIALFWMPVDVISFIRWHKHPDQEDENLTIVKRLKPWQTALVVAGIFAFGFGVGSLLQRIPDAADSYLDAFATAVGMTNGVLLLLRYNEQWIAWLITTILYIFMDINAGAYILLVSEIAMLVNTIYGMVKWYLYTDFKRSGYCNIVLHTIMLIFLGWIWNFVWIYQVTKVLNKSSLEERSPARKTLLCIFVPFYYIYWIYQSSQRIDDIAQRKGIISNITTLCTLLSIVVGILSPIIMQKKINEICD